MLKPAALVGLDAFEALDATVFRLLMRLVGRKASSRSEANAIHFFVGSLGLGGAQRQLAVLVRYLVDRGHRCKVWVIEDEDCFRAAVEQAGATVECLFEQGPRRIPVSLRKVGRVLRHRSHVWKALALARRLRRERCAVLQCLLNTTNVAGALAGRLAGVPVVVAGLRNVHPEEPGHPAASVFYTRCYRLLEPILVDALVANSESGRQSFLRYQPQFPAANIHVIKNGLDRVPLSPRTNAEILQSVGVDVEVPIILWAGRLAPEKRPDVLIGSLGAESGRPFIALLAGEGRTLSEARALTEAHGLTARVRFLGIRGDVSDLLRVARVAVLTSDVEGLPNFLVEAHLAACPVVATRVGGVDEVVEDGVTGFLAPCGDAAAIAARLARLIDDPVLAARMGQAGVERARRLFAADRMGEETLSLYHRLASAKGVSLSAAPVVRVPTHPSTALPRLHPMRIARGAAWRMQRALDACILAALSIVAVAMRAWPLGNRKHPEHREGPLRIFFFIPHLGMGGAQKALVNLVNGIDAHHYQVEVCASATRDNFFKSSFRSDRLTFTWIPAHDGTPLWQVTWSLARRIREARPDVVVGWMHWATNVAALAGALTRTPRVCVSFHGMSPLFRNPRPARTSQLLDTATGIVADAVLACSRASASSYQRWARIRPSKLHVLPNACDVTQTPVVCKTELSHRRTELGLTAQPMIGYVGRLAWEKGGATFLETVRRVSSELPNVAVIVVGDGVLRDELVAMANALGLGERVQFVAPQQDAQRYIAVLDVLLLLSESEGFGMVSIEAQASEVPVVITAAGGTPETIVDGETGFVVPVGDAAGAAEATVRLLRDPDLRSRMGRAGRRHVQSHFDVPLVASAFLAHCHGKVDQDTP